MIKEIIEGYTNYLKQDDETVQDIAKKRAEICAKCPSAKTGLHSALLPDGSLGKIKGKYCGECGCPLSPKVRSKSSKCPLNKWPHSSKN